MIRDAGKAGLHPRNRFRAGYDFTALLATTPRLAGFVGPNAYGDTSIDYANPAAVKALNQALLSHGYGVRNWDIPPGYLCPPVPGRSDYLHYLADLLAPGGAATIPRGPSVRVLDIGTGANCIYPLIGASEYGWRFVGTEIDPVAVRWAQKTVAMNPTVANLIECRVQPSPVDSFRGVMQSGECFDLSMCNPPFHASAADAAAGTRRKQRNLGLSGRRSTVEPTLNFGGKAGELWCPGGELAFVRNMITQSANVPTRFRWFTTLVSKSGHLPPLQATLRDVRAADVKVIHMAQGQKKSRILAWTFRGAA
jgi:23S rRNA (adenine1618-N6)-methyltransferase